MSRIETQLFPFGYELLEPLIMNRLMPEVKSFAFLTRSERQRREPKYLNLPPRGERYHKYCNEYD